MTTDGPPRRHTAPPGWLMLAGWLALALVGHTAIWPAAVVFAQPGPADPAAPADPEAAQPSAPAPAPFADVLRAFMRAVGTVDAPVELPADLLPSEQERRIAAIRAERLDAAAAAGAACVAHTAFDQAPDSDRMDVWLALAGVELRRGQFDPALRLLALHQAVCSPPRATSGAARPMWPPDRRSRYVQGLVSRIRIHLSRYDHGDGPAADEDLAAARRLRHELQSIDSTLAARIMPDLFPPFLPGDACPAFVARVAAAHRGDLAGLANDMARRGFDSRAVKDAGNGLFSLDGLRGGVLVVVFWQRTDPVSEHVARQLGQLMAEHAGARLLVLGVNVDPTPEPLRRALAGTDRGSGAEGNGAEAHASPPLSRPQFHEPPPDRQTDPTTLLRVKFACRRMPWVVVVDRAGRIVRTSSSVAELPRVRAIVAELLTGG